MATTKIMPFFSVFLFLVFGSLAKVENQIQYSHNVNTPEVD